MASTSKRIKSSSSSHLTASKSSKTVLKCVLCSREFKTHSALKMHFRQHAHELDLHGRPKEETELANQAIPCEFCSELSFNISNAIKHKYRKHRNVGKNHFCEQCGKLFPIKIALIQHKSIEHSIANNTIILKNISDNEKLAQCNSNKNEFHCEDCSATFLNKTALEFHEKQVHQFHNNLLLPMYTPSPSKKIKSCVNGEILSIYYCHLCGSEYMRKFNLKQHIITCHSDEQQNTIPEDFIRCHTCEAVFFNQNAYEVHLVHHRPDDVYVTDEEQRKQVISRVDQDFDLRRVPEINPQGKCKKKQITKVKKIKIENSDDKHLSPLPSDTSDEEPFIINETHLDVQITTGN